MLPHIVFDVDGVLISTDSTHFDALNRALVAVGAQQISHEEHLLRFKGHPTGVKLAWLVEEGRLAARDVERVQVLKQDATLPAVCRVPYDPEKPRLLIALRDEGWRIAACSNAVRATLRAMLTQAGVHHLVEFSLCNEDVVLPKPAPDVYRAAARKFGVDPGELVVVEDGAPGIQAARTAGCRVIRVEGPEEVTMALLPRIREMA